MDYKIMPKIEKLNTKIDDIKSQLTEKLVRQEQNILTAVTSIKSDVSESLFNHIQDFNIVKNELTDKYSELSSNMLSQYNQMKYDLKNYQDRWNQELNIRESVTAGSIKTLTNKIDRMHFDIIDNHDNIAVTYVNPDGKLEYGAIKKVLPDDVTIKMNADNKLYLNYTFDPQAFLIDTSNKIVPNSLYLGNNTYISGTTITKDIKSAQYNVEVLQYKVDKVLSKLDLVNGYVASNDFKKAKLTSDELTEFALSCLSSKFINITPSDLSAGTKIKNLHDNHIWILNKIKGSDGLTQNVWEDFGSDNICTASNNGVYGLVTGSQDKLKGYIDIKGVISINGLEEELNNLMTAIVAVRNDINETSLQLREKLSELENRLALLER